MPSVMEHDYKSWDDNWLGTKVTGIDILKRTVDILTDEIYLDDIRGVLDWNEVARKILTLKKELQSHIIFLKVLHHQWLVLIKH